MPTLPQTTATGSNFAHPSRVGKICAMILLANVPVSGMSAETSDIPLLAPVEVTVPPQSERSNSVTIITEEQILPTRFGCALIDQTLP